MNRHRLAGLALGVIAGLLIPRPGLADDLRTNQSLVEAGIFLGQAEAEAAFARLDADRNERTVVLPAVKTFVDVGAASYGQAERGARMGYGGSSSQLMVGVDREISNGVVVGVMAGGGAGDVSSGDLSGGTLAQHVDVYGRVKRGSLFAKLLFGGSIVGFRAIDRGPDDARTFGRSVSRNARGAAQIGGDVSVRGVKVSPTFGVALSANALSGYRESGGDNAFSYKSRHAQAAIGSFRLKATRAFRIDRSHKVELQAFVGADETLGFSTDALRASSRATGAIRQSWKGHPTGRGVVGGVGLGTALADGVEMSLSYDYGARDGFATHAGRARLGISF